MKSKKQQNQRETDSSIPVSYFKNESAYRSGGNNLTSAVCTVGSILKPHPRHDIRDNIDTRYIIIYVLRGEGTYIDWNGKTHPLYPGVIAQRIPGRLHSTLHRYGNEEPWCEMYLGLSRDFFNALYSTLSINPEMPVFDIGLHLSVAEQFKNILTLMNDGREHDAECLLAAHRLVLDLYERERAARAPSKKRDMIEEARKILDKNFPCGNDLRALAHSMNLSYERFRKLFREETGVSPGAYRIRRRIEAACRLLAERALSVKEIAGELGYPDIHSFSKQFAKMQGITPSEFRRRHPFG